MKKPIKRVAAIHDLCGVGKAALTNVLPILSMLDVEVCPIPTMILTTHTGGFNPRVVKLDSYISKAFEHYKEINIDFEGIFVGYLGSNNNIEETLHLLESVNRNNSLIVVDPIFADHGKYYSNFDRNYSENLKKLIRYSNIITPNFTEACILADEIIADEVSEEKLLMISRKLHKLGSENIVITSVPLLDKNKIGTAIYYGENDSLKLIVCERLKKSYPGTGDIFTSVLIGMFLNGKSLSYSVKKSCEFVEKCIIESSAYNYPTNEGILLESVLKQLNTL
jgi:pyridoxine kinase